MRPHPIRNKLTAEGLKLQCGNHCIVYNTIKQYNMYNAKITVIEYSMVLYHGIIPFQKYDENVHCKSIRSLTSAKSHQEILSTKSVFMFHMLDVLMCQCAMQQGSY